MEITSIKESGSNNILLWAISNGADIKNDLQLQSIINNELFYLVTMKDVNLFELFRLSQMYREKLRIVGENPADAPSRKQLQELIKGTYKSEDGTIIQNHEAAEFAITNFMNLCLQMKSDDDIIHPSTLRLCIPMICRKFIIQIPVSFMDLVRSLSEDESANLFTEYYPGTIQNIIDTPNHNFINIMKFAFVKGTSILEYGKRYNQYVDFIKYSPLKTCKNHKLYKFALIGFHKYDNISRGEVRCSLFNLNSKTFGNTLKKLNLIKGSPLKAEFVIQLPIQYMQILLNSYTQEDLMISYESPMSNIISNNLIFDDIIMPTLYDIDTMSEDEKKQFETRINAFSAYKTRIAEANQVAINTITAILNTNDDTDVPTTFSILPSLYMTNAVITVDVSQSDKYIKHNDGVISEMFSDIFNIAKTILNDMQASN